MKKPRKIVLPNGLTLWVDYRPKAKHQHMIFIINAGGHEGAPGEMHLLEHLVSRNHPKLNHKQIERYFDKNGGDAMLGQICSHYTQYSFRLPHKKGLVEEGLKIFEGFLLGAQITHGLRQEREVIKQTEFAFYYEIPKVLERQMALSEALCGDRWHGKIRTLGTPDVLDSITTQGLQRLYDRYYVPQNIDIIVSGALSVSEIKELIQNSSLSNISEGCRNIRPIPEKIRPLPSQTLMEESMSSLGSSSNITRFTMSWLIPKHINRELISITRDMISHRLFEKFRHELGIAYGVDVDHDTETTYDTLKIEIEIPPHANIYQIMCEEVAKSLRSSFLFHRQKKISVNAYGYDDHMSQKDWLNEYATQLAYHGKMETFEERKRKVEALVFKDVEIFRDLLRPENGITQIWHP